MKYLIIPILIYLGYVPPSGVPGHYELKFVALGGLVLILGLTYKPSFVKMDVFYGLFILACLFSMVDMQEIAWAWQPLFSWIAVILLAIWGRPFFKENEILINVFLQVLYWATIGFFAYHILLLKTPGVSFLEISYMGEMFYGSLECHYEYYYEGWSKWFNNNFNMATMVPMILLAPVLFGKYFKGWWWIYRIVAAIPAFYLVHYFNSQLGVVVGLFYLFMIPFWYLPTKILLPTIALAAGGLYYFKETFLLKIKTFLDSGSYAT